MKSWEQIKKEAKRSDWARVAEMAGCSRKNVELVALNLRPDNYNLQRIFSEYLTARERIAQKYTKKN